MTIAMQGATLLAEWRAQQGLKQGVAAKMMGVSQTSFSDYERGRKKPRIEHAISIDRVTGGHVPVAAWGESASQTKARVARVVAEQEADAPPASGQTLPDNEGATGTGG